MWHTNIKLIGPSPSGKAPGFDPGIRWFESSRPSHSLHHSDFVLLAGFEFTTTLEWSSLPRAWYCNQFRQAPKSDLQSRQITAAACPKQFQPLPKI